METDILKLFGNRIKQLRIEKKWSQQELADETGFHKNYIGMVERGERNIALKNIEPLAKIFNLSISELLNF
jgi:transcriptional regulator with XRE-family HTH domain